MGVRERQKQGSLVATKKRSNFEICFSSGRVCFGTGHRPQPALKYLEWTTPRKYSYKHSCLGEPRAGPWGTPYAETIHAPSSVTSASANCSLVVPQALPRFSHLTYDVTFLPLEICLRQFLPESSACRLLPLRRTGRVCFCAA